ncbi:MAG: ABC transporter permease [Candidatus Krumholzibacteriota bacterium]|nr:ABC transporter permease [Candidatus Krumholzibacteriota bacterium]
MKSYIFGKILRVIPLVILISVITFALLHLAPGGPVGIVAGNPKVSADDLSRLRESYGLDDPLPVQYLHWFKQVFLRFDFGKSYVNGRPVTAMIRERIPATLELMGSAFLLALIVSCVMGVFSALKRDSAVDHFFSAISVTGTSLPVFWFALMAIYLFSLRLGLLPAGGRETLAVPHSVLDRLHHLILPASVLSLTYLASWSRYLRAGLLDTFSGDFIRTARAKGLSERSVILKHALRNAVLPVLTVVVMQIPTLFTGAVITETVFAWPGMGRFFYEGMQRQDYSRVLGIVVISSLLIILFNFAGDILCLAVDPRIRPGRLAGGGKNA